MKIIVEGAQLILTRTSKHQFKVELYKIPSDAAKEPYSIFIGDDITINLPPTIVDTDDVNYAHADVRELLSKIS